EIIAVIEERYFEIQKGKAARKANETWPPKPPWLQLPGYDMTSMAWRMGGGEDIRLEFFRFFSSLTDHQQKSYEETWPEPDGWQGYYGLIIERSK
ncbi:MAG: hypothetical protein ACFBZ9_09530, partial [Sphingomonadales bacterium]